MGRKRKPNQMTEEAHRRVASRLRAAERLILAAANEVRQAYPLASRPGQRADRLARPTNPIVRLKLALDAQYYSDGGSEVDGASPYYSCAAQDAEDALLAQIGGKT